MDLLVVEGNAGKRLVHTAADVIAHNRSRPNK